MGKELYAIPCAFIALDFFAGLLKAFATSTFSSQVMRKGLWHKVSLLCVLGLSLLMDYAQPYFDLGANVPIAGAVGVYIVLMEAGSTVKNLCTANPELMSEQLCKLFGVPEKGGDHEAE